MQAEYIGKYPTHFDGEDVEEPTVLMTDGRMLTKKELIEHLNSQFARVVIQENVHEDDVLYLMMPFDNKREFLFGEED